MVLGPGPLFLCWQQPPEGSGALCWQLLTSSSHSAWASHSHTVHPSPEHSQSTRVPWGPGASLMSACPHCARTPRHRLGGTPRWPRDRPSGTPAWTWQPPQSPGGWRGGEGGLPIPYPPAHPLSPCLSPIPLPIPYPPAAWQGPGTHQRDISHGIHHDTLVLRRVLRDAAQPRLQHVVTVEEGLLRARLHPHLVLRERGRAVRSRAAGTGPGPAGGP